MATEPGSVVEQQLKRSNFVQVYQECDRFVFTGCGEAKAEYLSLQAKQRSPGWQVGFFGADGEVCFNKIEIEQEAQFSSVVRNYWCNGEEGDGRKEGYYSLISSVRMLYVNNTQFLSDLADYVEGKYQAGEHWKARKLSRDLDIGVYEADEATFKRLEPHFDRLFCHCVIVDLGVENNVTCSCEQYKFVNCDGVAPQRLTVHTDVKSIVFAGSESEVRVPEIVIEEQARFESIVKNEWQNDEFESHNVGEEAYEEEESDESHCYSLIQHVGTLTIKDNPSALCDLTRYVAGEYKIEDEYDGENWVVGQLSKEIKIVIEKPGLALDAVKVIAGYFNSVTIGGRPAGMCLEALEQQRKSYEESFKSCFSKSGLKTEPVGDFLGSQRELTFSNQTFHVARGNRKIELLQVDQKLEPNQFVCFHGAGKPVFVDRVCVKDEGDLRSVLQNVYFNGQDGCFFSLLQTIRRLEINNPQAAEDLADYIEGRYVLNQNWKAERPNKDMEVSISHTGPNIARRLRAYFTNVSVDYIRAPLQPENVVDQECQYYQFTDSGQVCTQSLTVNTKITDDYGSLIMFIQIANEVHIPEITIGKHGELRAIVCNQWDNDNQEYGCYSLIQHVETLIIDNNSAAIRDLADYIAGNCKTNSSEWKVQGLSKYIKIRINGVTGYDTILEYIKEYFGYIIADNRKKLGSERSQEINNILYRQSAVQEHMATNDKTIEAIAQLNGLIEQARRKTHYCRVKLQARKTRFREYLKLAE